MRQAALSANAVGPRLARTASLRPYATPEGRRPVGPQKEPAKAPGTGWRLVRRQGSSRSTYFRPPRRPCPRGRGEVPDRLVGRRRQRGAVHAPATVGAGHPLVRLCERHRSSRRLHRVRVRPFRPRPDPRQRFLLLAPSHPSSRDQRGRVASARGTNPHGLLCVGAERRRRNSGSQPHQPDRSRRPLPTRVARLQQCARHPRPVAVPGCSRLQLSRA